ncbi:ATP-dependent RNA helicase DbpA [Marinobacter daqiaonensis]|uniref:ATP-dependent RNA helicase DbpA n=1 Tax=Marinobacter daqiaonensis TaxID=650891 RepID=A0A1I6GGQ7_9GAMM|nr:ATP-dependent RNA helicase DbpA [Marinobacter daqiaonensis]SFR41359.1 ATP-dependent RNA helicase DbpA [Marinobacter daqiaonensis]
MTEFNIPGLSSAMLRNLKMLGFDTPTPVQEAAIPAVLEGRDVIAMARTGSGKTAAFGIGMVEKLEVKRFSVQGLVLCPTRELADQVARALRDLARAQSNVKILTLCGGVPIGPQIGSLSHGAHLIVGTPGRIQDHLNKETLTLEDLKMLVLDEADRMLDMGFQESMDFILSRCPPRRQTLLFSATWPDQIRRLSSQYQRDPVTITVTRDEEPAPAIREVFYEVAPGEERQALVGLLSQEQPESCLVFCGTRQECDLVASSLVEKGFSALALHGDMEQRDRDLVLTRFANQSCSVLVATDVAARGLDIDDLPLVVNLEPARSPETHTHRIGRTGRAGREGLAVTFFTPPKAYKITKLEQVRGEAVEPLPGSALLAVPPAPFSPPRVTLCIAGGRKEKVRPGDILGALTGEAGLPAGVVGKIAIQDFQSFVAVDSGVAAKALKRLEAGRIKGRKFRVRMA